MKFLIIQTAFIGDVILATPIVASLRRHFPQADIDFLVRKGNESLLAGHPYLRKVLIWEKSRKYQQLFRMLFAIRKTRYDVVINCQRFAASGILTAFSGAGETIGFKKNPLSLFFSRRLPHNIGDGVHEVQRNQTLIRHLVGDAVEMPRLYPAPADYEHSRALANGQSYVCIAPSSVWFTKQWPAHKWLAFMQKIPSNLPIFLLGSKGDAPLCEQLCASVVNQQATNLAGQCSFLESAALMQGAAMNYVNDSGPMHLASAVNAPVLSIFCSTVPAFGFGPLSKQSIIVETQEALACRPCGLHGFKACPEGHFKCAESIPVEALYLPGTVWF